MKKNHFFCRFLSRNSPMGSKVDTKSKLIRQLGDTVDLSSFDYQTGRTIPNQLQQQPGIRSNTTQRSIIEMLPSSVPPKHPLSIEYRCRLDCFIFAFFSFFSFRLFFLLSFYSFPLPSPAIFSVFLSKKCEHLLLCRSPKKLFFFSFHFFGNFCFASFYLEQSRK